MSTNSNEPISTVNHSNQLPLSSGYVGTIEIKEVIEFTIGLLFILKVGTEINVL